MLLSNLFHFTLRALQGRWFMFFTSILMMAAGGATYIYAVYSKDLKSTLGYNQQHLNTIAFFKDIGSNVGIVAGLIGDFAPPWLVVSIGATFNLVGYLMIYLVITGRVARPHLWQMCLYMLIATNSQTFTSTAAIVTSVKNFPRSRGFVIGLLKGFLGLSGAILTQVYLAVYGQNPKMLVLLVMWLPTCVCFILAPTIRIIRVAQQPKEFKVFCKFLYMSFALAAYIMVLIIVQKRTAFSRSEYRISATFVLLLLFLPIILIIREEFKLFKLKKNILVENPQPVISVQVEQLDMADVEVLQRSGSAELSSSNSGRANRNSLNIRKIVKALKAPKRGDDYSILQAIVSIEMLILLSSTITGIGGTLAAIDNMGQIGESLGYPIKSISTFVSLLNIWSFMGRVGAGFVSEILLTRFKFPRPLLFVLVMLIACGGHLLIAFGVHGSLYVVSVIIGLCFGAQIPLLIAIMSELFGLKYFSTLFNVAGFASPIASYLLNVRVVGYLYDREAAKQNEGKVFGSSDKKFTCIGVQCFKMSFLIITGVTLLGALLMLVLVWRTKDFYRGDIYAKFKEASSVDEISGEKESKDELVTKS